MQPQSLIEVLRGPYALGGLSAYMMMSRETDQKIESKTGIKRRFHFVLPNKEIAKSTYGNLNGFSLACPIAKPCYSEEKSVDANMVVWEADDFWNQKADKVNRRSICYIHNKIPHLDLLFDNCDNVCGICELLSTFRRVERFGKFAGAS